MRQFLRGGGDLRLDGVEHGRENYHKRGQAPSTNIQAPEKFQIPICKLPRLLFEVW
jgi:hypothetical protein